MEIQAFYFDKSLLQDKLLDFVPEVKKKHNSKIKMRYEKLSCFCLFQKSLCPVLLEHIYTNHADIFTFIFFFFSSNDQTSSASNLH